MIKHFKNKNNAYNSIYSFYLKIVIDYLLLMLCGCKVDINSYSIYQECPILSPNISCLLRLNLRLKESKNFNNVAASFMVEENFAFKRLIILAVDPFIKAFIKLRVFFFINFVMI